MRIAMTYNLLETCMLAPGFNRAECASWVQAWGSILAICAAVLIAYIQHRQNLRQQQRLAALARSQAAAAPFAVAERTIAELKKTFTRLKRPVGNDGDWSAFPGLKIELQKLLFDYKKLPLNALATYEAIHAAYRLADLMEDSISDLAEMASLRADLQNIDRRRQEAFVDRMLDMSTECKTLEVEWRKGGSDDGA